MRHQRQKWMQGIGLLVCWAVISLLSDPTLCRAQPQVPQVPRVDIPPIMQIQPKLPELLPKQKQEELPPPRRFLPFGPNRPRLPVLPEGPGQLATTPKPTQKDIKKELKFIDEFIDPSFTLDLVVGRARLIVLKDVPKRIQIVDETIATYNLVEPKELTVLGQQVGTTVLNMWFTDPKTKKDVVLSYLVRVIPDPEVRERLEQVYKALEEEINEAFPDSVVHLQLVGDKLVVRGQARDIVDATQIIRIVSANAPPEDQATIPVESININLPPFGDPSIPPGGLPGLRNFLLAGGANVINLLRIPGEQQVMLKVTVAEVDRAAARSIGLNFTITNDDGVMVFANNTGFITGGGLGGGGGAGGGAGGGGLGSLAGGALGGLGGAIANLPVMLDNGQISLAINALRSLTYARSLAEPNLVALNGETATFQAGGQFPVPITTGATFSGLQGVSFVPFGVQLAFTPYITDKDRIRLAVAASVSVRDLAGGASIGGANVPGLITRNFQTVVELREGQTMAVAGLIQKNLASQADRVPLIGDLPLLNNLTGYNRIQAGEQELVVLVTPELVHPMDGKEVPSLPGSDLFEPGDLEFYIHGRLESRREYDFRSPVMNDFHRMQSYRRCERFFISGPQGHTPLPIE